jgi:ubiquinone/menaquinone biosynthesis C-methylase UbiE
MDRLLELTSRAEQSHFWFRGFRWFVQPEVMRAVNGRTSLTLLDCGCGTGSNVAWLRAYGRAYGFDLTWNGLTLGRQMGRRTLARASIGAIPFPDASVDVATSFDVFQCLPDEVELAAIRELFRVVRPGGHLILNVAALNVLRGNHSVLSEEVRRYTPARLRQVVETGGFVLPQCSVVSNHASHARHAALEKRSNVTTRRVRHAGTGRARECAADRPPSSRSRGAPARGHAVWQLADVPRSQARLTLRKHGSTEARNHGSAEI